MNGIAICWTAQIGINRKSVTLATLSGDMRQKQNPLTTPSSMQSRNSGTHLSGPNTPRPHTQSILRSYNQSNPTVQFQKGTVLTLDRQRTRIYDSSDPRHPFARATFIPREPQTEIRISSNPETKPPNQSPSVLKNFYKVFRPDKESKLEGDVEVSSHDSELSPTKQLL